MGSIHHQSPSGLLPAFSHRQKALRLWKKISSTDGGLLKRFTQSLTASASRIRWIDRNNDGSWECYHYVIRGIWDGAGSLAVAGFQSFSLYSHSMQSNAFSLILVFPVRSRGSDSTDYLYSPCSTASVYHLFISVIKRLSCCGSRGNFPGIVTDFVFWRVAETCLPA